MNNTLNLFLYFFFICCMIVSYMFKHVLFTFITLESIMSLILLIQMTRLTGNEFTKSMNLLKW